MHAFTKTTAVLVILAFAASAQAALTTVYQTSFGNEKNLIDGLPSNPSRPAAGVSDILNSADWVRIDDSIDQLWLDTNGGVSVEAIFTSNDLTFGVAVNPNLAGPAPVLDTNLWTTAPAGGTLDSTGESGSFDVDNTLPLVFGVTLTNGSKTLYSYEGFNGGRDRMVTFYNASEDKWAFGFEDSKDLDFQDFVLILDHVAPIPVPGAALLGMLGLSAIGWFRRNA